MKIYVISSNWIFQKENKFFGKPQYKFLDELANKKKLAIYILAPVLKTNITKGFELKNLKIKPLPFFRGTIDQVKKIYLLPLILYKFFKELRNADLVIIYNRDLFSTLGLIIAKLLRKKVVYIIGDIWVNNIKYKHGKWLVFFYKPLFLLQKIFLNLERNKSLILTNTNRLINFNEKIIEEAKALKVPYKEYIASIVSEKDFFNRKWPDFSQKKDVNILYVGWLIKNKGVQDLIQAVSKLQKEVSERQINLHIVGDGEYREFLQNLAKKLNVNAKFYGLIFDWNKLLEIYRKADIFVQPSYGEALSKVVIEAFSQSLIVVCSDIINIDGCIKFKTGDVDDLKETLKRIITNKISLEDYFKKIEKARSNLSMEKAIDLFYSNITSF